MSTLKLTYAQLSLAFPFHFVVDRNLTLMSAGPALMALLPALAFHEPIAEHLTLTEPSDVGVALADWRRCIGRAVVLRTSAGQTLRGQLVDDDPAGGLAFLGALWAQPLEPIRSLPAYEPSQAQAEAQRAQQAITDELRSLNARLRGEQTKLARARRYDQIRAEVGDVLVRSSSIKTAAPPLLATLCERLEVAAVCLWVPDYATRELVCIASHALGGQNGLARADFAAAARRQRLPFERGLPGRVQLMGTPVWLPDLTADDIFGAHDSAARAGLRGAVAFPARSDRGLYAILELFAEDLLPRDGELASLVEEQMQKLADFAERRRALDERHTLASLVDCARVFIGMVALDGTPLYVNGAGREMLGLPLGGSLGTHFDSAYVPETRQRIREVALPAVSATGSWSGEGRLQTGDRPPLDVSIHLFLLRSGVDGAPQHLAIVQQDISAQRRVLEALRDSELHYRNIVDEVQEVVFRCDPQSRWTLLNRAWETLTGLSTEESLGQHAAQLVHVEDQPLNRGQFDQLRRRQVDHTRHVVRFVRRDGSVRQAEIYARALFTDDGVLEGFSGTINDITEQRNTIEVLTRAKEVAEQATQAKSQFLANMSHEIRTPMNGVLGLMEVLASTPLDADQRQILNSARSSADILLALVEDVLDFSKIEARQVRTERIPLEPGALVEQLLQPLERSARERGVALTWHLDAAVPAVVVGDPQRLKQVLANLVGNALKFTRIGGVHVDVAVDDGAAGDGLMLSFAVRDSGIGIEPAKQAVIFEAFAQADGTISRRFGGSGLGLAICKELVQLMGGTLTVTSEVGRGSVFRFGCRVGRAPAPAAAPAATAVTRPVARPLEILLAEDNPINQVVASRLLTQAGHRVTAVADGHQALQMIDERRFDLVLMDVQMPNLDGLETTRILRQREARGGRRLPVLALTAQTLREDHERCLAAGMDGYVPKPLRIATLLAAIDELTTTAAPPWNRAAMLRLLDGVEDIMDELLLLFATDGPSILADVRAAVDSGQAHPIEQQAHRIKGALLNLAAGPAADCARQLEQAGRAGDLAEAKRAMAALEHEMARLWPAIQPRASAAS